MPELTLDNFFVTVLDSDLRQGAAADQRRVIRLTQTRLALFLTDTETGVPLCDLPLQVFVECDVRYLSSDSNQTVYEELPPSIFSYRIPLGLLAADHVGYASFDLRRLPGLVDLSDVSPKKVSSADSAAADAVAKQQVTHTSIRAIWVHPYGDYAFDALTPGLFALRPDAIVVKAALSDGTARAMLANTGIPSMQEPGIVDWRLSPGSFAIRPTLKIGEDECARLTPGSGALDTHYFHRIVVDKPGAPPSTDVVIPAGASALPPVGAPPSVTPAAPGGPAPAGPAPAPAAPTPMTDVATIGITGAPAGGAAPVPSAVGAAPAGPASPAAPAAPASGAVTAADMGLAMPAGAIAIRNLPDLRTGRLHVYRTDWYQLGHSLGKVLYSLALAPGENSDIAIIDWSREDVAGRSETTALSEAVFADLRRDRTITETISAALSEKQSGGSTMGAGSLLAGAAGSTGPLGAAIGLGFSLGGGSSWTGAQRDLHESTVQNLADRITQSASAIRELRSSVVVTAHQREQQVLTTRNLTNYNHSHTLTVLYYELLRHIRVVTAFDRSYEAMLVRFPPLQISRNDPTSLFRYLPFLRADLMDPTLAAAFDAYELYELETQRPDPLAQGSPDADVLIEGIIGDIVVRPRKATDGARTAVGVGVVDVNGNVSVMGASQIPVDPMKVDVNGTSVPKSELLEVSQFFPVPWFGNHLFDEHDKSYIDDTYRNANDMDFNLLFASPVRWGDLRYLKLQCIFQDRDTQRNMRLGLRVVTGMTARGPIDLSLPQDDLNFQNLDDAGRVVTIPSASSSITGTLRYLLRTPPPPPAPRAPFDRLTPDQQRLVMRLLTHVVDNVQGYSALYWRDHEIERIRILENLGSLFDGSYYPVDSLGDYLVFPRLVSNQVMPTDLVVDERLLTLPTPGVFADARLGNCNVSEVIDDTRFWDWQRSPIPFRAPEITGVHPESQKLAPSVQPTTLPAATVGLQTVPAAPDPATVAALNALSRPDIFRDMSIAKEVAGVIEQVTRSTAEVAKAAAGLVSVPKQETPPATQPRAPEGEKAAPAEAPSLPQPPTPIQPTSDTTPQPLPQPKPAPTMSGGRGGGGGGRGGGGAILPAPLPGPTPTKVVPAASNSGQFDVVLENPPGFNAALVGVAIRTFVAMASQTKWMTVRYPASLANDTVAIHVSAYAWEGSDYASTHVNFDGFAKATTISKIATVRARIPSKTISVTLSGKFTGSAKLAAEVALQLKGTLDLKAATLEQILSNKFGPTLDAGIDFGAGTTIVFEVIDPGKPLQITVEEVPSS